MGKRFGKVAIPEHSSDAKSGEELQALFPVIFKAAEEGSIRLDYKGEEQYDLFVKSGDGEENVGFIDKNRASGWISQKGLDALGFPVGKVGLDRDGDSFAMPDVKMERELPGLPEDCPEYSDENIISETGAFGL